MLEAHSFYSQVSLLVFVYLESAALTSLVADLDWDSLSLRSFLVHSGLFSKYIRFIPKYLELHASLEKLTKL